MPAGMSVGIQQMSVGMFVVIATLQYANYGNIRRIYLMPNLDIFL